jgi:hypothetical protein
VAEFIFRLLLAIVLGLAFAAPISLVVFVYSLANGRSLSEAVAHALDAAVNIVGEVASQT